MDPSVYIPAYLERAYLASHPELTDAARELVHNDVSVNPHKYAQSEHAQALLSYAGRSSPPARRAPSASEGHGQRRGV